MSVPRVESQSTSPLGVERLKEPGFQRSVVDLFHYLFYHDRGRTWLNTYWQGVQVTKCPLDLWIYQEILFEVRPDVIIECGTSYGGSALYLAGLCELLGTGRIYSVDINQRRELPTHARIEFLRGSSTSPEIVESLKSRIRPDEKVLVSLDSNHSKKHVLAELESYAPLVTPGSYLIVEDTNINGHPVFPDFGPGPMEALDEFFLRNDDFETDLTREKFFLTFNPRGYLRRVRKRNDATANPQPVPRGEVVERIVPTPALDESLLDRDDRPEEGSLAEREQASVQRLKAELRARHRELAGLFEQLRAKNETITGLLQTLEERDAQVRERDAILHQLFSTRLFRLASWYWALRDRMRVRTRPRA